MTTPMRARTARPIKTHTHGATVPLAAGELVGSGSGVVASGVGDGASVVGGGAVVTSGVGDSGALVSMVGRLGGEMVMPWLAAALAIASLTAPPHPATRNAAAKTPTARTNRPLHLRLDIEVILWLPARTGLPSSWVRR